MVPTPPTPPVGDCKPQLAKSVRWKSALQLLIILLLEELKRASKLTGNSLVPIMKGKNKRGLRGNIITPTAPQEVVMRWGSASSPKITRDRTRRNGLKLVQGDSGGYW